MEELATEVYDENHDEVGGGPVSVEPCNKRVGTKSLVALRPVPLGCILADKLAALCTKAAAEFSLLHADSAQALMVKSRG